MKKKKIKIAKIEIRMHMHSRNTQPLVPFFSDRRSGSSLRRRVHCKRAGAALTRRAAAVDRPSARRNVRIAWEEDSPRPMRERPERPRGAHERSPLLAKYRAARAVDNRYYTSERGYSSIFVYSRRARARDSAGSPGPWTISRGTCARSVSRARAHLGSKALANFDR